MKKLLLLCVLFLSCNFGEINNIGHKKKDKPQKKQQEYTLYMWGKGNYDIFIIKLFNDIISQHRINLKPDEFGFVADIDTTRIKQPYTIKIENLDNLNAIYEFGELNFHPTSPITNITGVFGKFNKIINFIILSIDKDGIITLSFSN